MSDEFREAFEKLRSLVAKKLKDTPEQRILRALADHGPAAGLALTQRGCASRGTIYVHLSNMEEDGLVDSWEETGPTGFLRRMYRITAIGRRVLE